MLVTLLLLSITLIYLGICNAERERLLKSQRVSLGSHSFFRSRAIFKPIRCADFHCLLAAEKAALEHCDSLRSLSPGLLAFGYNCISTRKAIALVNRLELVLVYAPSA